MTPPLITAAWRQLVAAQTHIGSIRRCSWHNTAEDVALSSMNSVRMCYKRHFKTVTVAHTSRIVAL